VGRPLVKAAIRILMASLLAYFLVSSLLDLRRNVSKRDSIAYWAAGRLLLDGQDPYDSNAVLGLETQQGYTDAKPLVLRTPPWSLFLVLPLGLMSAFWAWLAWVGFSLAAFVFSLHLCWKIYGSDARPPRFFWLLGYLFAPVPACLVAGQMGMVLLLGIMLFLWWEPRHPFLAGAVLILPLAKPHLLVLFWLIFAFWLVSRKQWAVAIGLVSAFLVAVAIALAFRPVVFQNYRDMLHQAAIGSEFIPALSGVLRLLFFHRLFWVQFIPMVAALIWSAWFYYVNRTRWDWRKQGLAIMVVSVLTTPYAWLTDEVVLIPAVLQAALWIDSARERITWRSKVAMTVFACFNGLLLLILWFKIPFSTGIYFWSSLVWFAWYVYGRNFSAENRAR
jgi:hypothetical protein